jgi:hypothetical protein
MGGQGGSWQQYCPLFVDVYKLCLSMFKSDVCEFVKAMCVDVFDDVFT